MTDLELAAFVIPLGLFVISCVIILALFVYSTERDIKKHLQGVRTNMAKFYEFTNRDDGHKILVNIEQISSIIEDDDGQTFVETFVGSVNSSECVGYRCAERYVDVYNDFVNMELI